jgi:hypothetical protein
MRASRAYIASFGTAGVLIASSVLLLLVVSTIVAFRGWPGDDIAKGIRGLVVDKGGSSSSTARPARAESATPAAAHVASKPRSTGASDGAVDGIVRQSPDLGGSGPAPPPTP